MDRDVAGVVFISLRSRTDFKQAQRRIWSEAEFCGIQDGAGEPKTICSDLFHVFVSRRCFERGCERQGDRQGQGERPIQKGKQKPNSSSSTWPTWGNATHVELYVPFPQADSTMNAKGSKKVGNVSLIREIREMVTVLMLIEFPMRVQFREIQLVLRICFDFFILSSKLSLFDAASS
jgi:hypothetical protein